jgi:hypothetical protein
LFPGDSHLRLRLRGAGKKKRHSAISKQAENVMRLASIGILITIVGRQLSFAIHNGLDL